MNINTSHDDAVRRLSCGVVLRVREEACDVLRHGHVHTAGYAPTFPSPRTERVSPGHLVAMTTAADGTATVIWRWYDAVVIDEDQAGVRLREPAHGEVIAQPRVAYAPGRPGTRAWLSAGLPGADWWVAGPASTTATGADVELAEVADFYTDHGLWHTLLGDDA
jgi:hypothetical protein